MYVHLLVEYGCKVMSAKLYLIFKWLFEVLSKCKLYHINKLFHKFVLAASPSLPLNDRQIQQLFVVSSTRPTKSLDLSETI